MSITPDLQFRRLEEGERELAGELVRSMLPAAGADGEAFGLRAGPPLSDADEGWGLFIRGNLVGAAWLRRSVGGEALVPALAVARGWWKRGLAEWMLGELEKSARLGGAGGIAVRLDEGGPALAEVLEDAGFHGPDRENGDFPLGEWKK